MEAFFESPTISPDGQEAEHAPQVFDTSLKDLVEQEATTILSELVKGVVYKETLTVELVRPTVRADKAYLVGYAEDGDHILHIEFDEHRSVQPSRRACP